MSVENQWLNEQESQLSDREKAQKELMDSKSKIQDIVGDNPDTKSQDEINNLNSALSDMVDWVDKLLKTYEQANVWDITADMVEKAIKLQPWFDKWYHLAAIIWQMTNFWFCTLLVPRPGQI